VRWTSAVTKQQLLWFGFICFVSVRSVELVERNLIKNCCVYNPRQIDKREGTPTHKHTHTQQLKPKTNLSIKVNTVLSTGIVL